MGSSSYDLSALAESASEERSLHLDWHGKRILTIPPPELWSDDVQRIGRAGDNEGSARALLGDGPYDAYVAATGLGAEMLWTLVIRHFGATSVGESSASSVS